MSEILTRNLTIRTTAILATAAFVLRPSVAIAQPDDVADVSSTPLNADGDEHKQYFLIGDTDTARAPKSGFGLLVVLPGGDGSAEFHPFVKRIYKNALPDHYLVAQPVAVNWTNDQQIVWPTEKTPVDEQKFTTEQFIESVISDVKKHHKINDKRVYTLSWSSSGPAAYATALQKKTAVCGSFIAMSVFKPNYLPDLEIAKGRLFYIFHSPDDRVCPFRMAEEARDQLKEAKAVVEFQRYDGGHGWRGDVFGNIRQGIDWLESMSKKKIKQARKEAETGEKKEETSAPKPARARRQP
ncbi:MAG: hypothetical protein H6818_10500 [Phycisphaerales bacterium]|nr:hypothetical protein [Phycisphaerales bacterium]MCB9863868.1 hypothetical protein [Phycisphaerales bacterium]